MKSPVLSAFVLLLLTGIAANAGLISKVPVVITKPGKYTLMKNLSTSANANPESNAAISIRASNVQLDLGGHSLIANPAATMVEFGILVGPGVKQVKIHNGRVTGFGLGVASSIDSEDLLLDGLELSSPIYCVNLYGSSAHIQNCGFSHTGITGGCLLVFNAAGKRQATTVDRCRFVALVTGTGDGQVGVSSSDANLPTIIRNCTFIGLSKGIIGNNETRIADNLFQACTTVQSGCTLVGYNQ